MGAQGVQQVNAGAIGSVSNEASVAITGQASILAGSLVEAWLFPADTTEHSADEHRFEMDTLKVWADTVVAGVGFTIRVRCTNGSLYGNWNVAWVWN